MMPWRKKPKATADVWTRPRARVITDEPQPWIRTTRGKAAILALTLAGVFESVVFLEDVATGQQNLPEGGLVRARDMGRTDPASLLYVSSAWNAKIGFTLQQQMVSDDIRPCTDMPLTQTIVDSLHKAGYHTGAVIYQKTRNILGAPASVAATMFNVVSVWMAELATAGHYTNSNHLCAAQINDRDYATLNFDFAPRPQMYEFNMSPAQPATTMATQQPARPVQPRAASALDADLAASPVYFEFKPN